MRMYFNKNSDRHATRNSISMEFLDPYLNRFTGLTRILNQNPKGLDGYVSSIRKESDLFLGKSTWHLFWDLAISVLIIVFSFLIWGQIGWMSLGFTLFAGLYIMNSLALFSTLGTLNYLRSEYHAETVMQTMDEVALKNLLKSQTDMTDNEIELFWHYYNVTRVESFNQLAAEQDES